MGLLLNGKQLRVTCARQRTLSANCDVVGLTGNSPADIAANVVLLLPSVSNLTDLHLNYSSLIHMPALKHLLQKFELQNSK